VPCRLSVIDPDDHGDEVLHDSIRLRQINRSIYNKKEISEAHKYKLIDANVFNTMTIKTFNPIRQETEPLIDLVKEANRLQFSDL
jgi:hypothetical protein